MTADAHAATGAGTPPLNSLILAVSAAGFIVTLGLVLGALGAEGHAAYNATNDGLFWTLPIVTYDFFLLTSTGLALTASLGLALGVSSFAVIARRCLWLALAGLAGGVLTLFLELGHPLRAVWAIPFSFQFASPLYWKVLAVGAYVLVLLAMILRTNRPDYSVRAVRPLAIVLTVLAVAVAMIAGSVFGMMAMRPFWFGGEIPVAFLIESVLGGMAFAVFFTYLAYGFDRDRMPEGLRLLLTGQLPFVFALVIVLHALFVAARTISGLWSNADGLQVWGHIASSPLFHLEIWVGVALPLCLMLSPGLRTQVKAQVGAALLLMVALFIARYDFIIGGQLVPPFKGSWAPTLLQYVPSTTEFLLLLAAIFLANLINAVGDRFLDLDRRPTED